MPRAQEQAPVPSPPWLRSQGNVVLLSIHLQPRASRDQIVGESGGALRVKVTAPPVDSAANEALARFLAKSLGCRPNQVQLVRGATSRHKVVAVHGLEIGTILNVLRPLS